MAFGHGGAREGAGAPSGPRSADRTEAKLDFESQRARHEKIKADEREFEFAIRRGEYLAREDQRRAAATAMALFVQSARSIPDNLERRLGLMPEVAEQIAVGIDEALSELAVAFKAMTKDD